MKNKGAVLPGLFACALGLFVVGMALWGSDSGFHAPRWVVGGAGGVFVLAGLAIFGQRYTHFSALVRALLLTVFGAIATWVSLAPGERQFSSTINLPFFSFSGRAPELLGRLCFAPGAILLDILALYSWFLFIRNWLMRDLQEE